ncbi:unnamed protein product [Rhizophagus irregularis]|nr:unnamed protein product [Rhizophagus irregularis]
MENKPKWLWKKVYGNEYQLHVTISTINSTTESEDADERIVYMEDLEKRKQVYGICGECNEPGTGWRWCQPCNAKRFKDNFKNWTSGNKDIDEFIQQSQLNAAYFKKCLEWIPFEKFQDITYIAEGGFGKIYSAKWPEGHIDYWDIENQKWHRVCLDKYALKSLNNSSNISSDFLNEIKSHLQIHLYDVVPCYGITQNPNTKDDLGMCQPANKKSVKEEGIYGVLPYMAPEVLRGHQYTKAADIYSFGIIMNELLSEEIPYVNSSDLSSFQFNSDAKYTIQSTLANPISECFDVQLSESELNEISQDDENNIES